MYKEVPSRLNYNSLEQEILSYWKENDTFKKSIKSDAPDYIFFEGPPTANGKPGIHHVMARTIKDIITRYKSLDGFKVDRKAGWDTHGLPVEIEVEKQLGLEGREQVLNYGLEAFNKKCRESVFTYKDQWDHLTERMGYWVDLENPYITCDTNYVESVWWILNQLFKKDLIYKGYKIQPYCPKCGTALSSHEVSQGYKDVKDLTAIARFPLENEEHTYVLAWTTTPWTLPSNMALAVGPDVDYVKIKHTDSKGAEEFLILAKDLVSSVIENDYEIVEEFKGSSLEGKSYTPLFNFTETNENSHKILIADFVTTTDGTGIVHMAPAYGEDDYQTCLKNNIPVDIIVKTDGTFSEKAGEFAGLNIKVADPEIVTNLKHRGLLFKSQKMEHSYPHCWRHGTPLFYYATDSWFIKTTQFRDKLLNNNKTVNWHPSEVGEGRFGKWLENNIDWSLSRRRYWGTPLNIWLTEDESEMKSVGSIAELKEEIQKSIDAGFMDKMPESFDLHKPYVDDIYLVSSKGEKMTRTTEVIDCWFDSGSMPLAQWHYPFENKEAVEQRLRQADFICEGIDQTRGWFYTLLAISTMLFDETPYKNVIVNNLILDKDGLKMSKSKGNTVNPFNEIETYGVDTLRWFFVTSSQPWVPKRYDKDQVLEVQRKFVGTLVNTYAFFVLYANVDKFDNTAPIIPIEERSEIDRWVTSLLYTTIDRFKGYMDNYDITSACRMLNDFLMNDVSNWYVRRNRRRFWKGELNSDKIAAYQTLYDVLMGIIKMASPIMPFLTEHIYQNLKKTTDPESIHMCTYPRLSESEKSHINPAIERKMALAQSIVELGRAIRSENNLKVRLPLASIKVFVEAQSDKKATEELSEIIREELNIKALEIVEDANSIVVRKPKPDFKKLGPAFGKLKIVNQVAEAIRQLSDDEFHQLEAGTPLAKTIEGHHIEITNDMYEVIHEKLEGLAVATSEGITVAIDTIVTDELVQEGKAREFVNRLQTARKEAGFDVVDRIHVTVETSDVIKRAVESQLDYVKNETLTLELSFTDSLTEAKEVEVEGETVRLIIRKA